MCDSGWRCGKESMRGGVAGEGKGDNKEATLFRAGTVSIFCDPEFEGRVVPST